MSYRNPQDGSPTYVVTFNHEQKDIDHMRKFIVDQFEKKDADDAEHKGSDQVRKSKIIWFNDKTISNILINCMEIANHETGWRYKITGHEALQMTRYDEGGEYGWHVDGDATHMGAKYFAGIRSQFF